MADKRLRSAAALPGEDPAPQAQVHDPSLRRTQRAEPDTEREPRAAQGRSGADDRVLSDQERLDVFRLGLLQGTLPDLPNLPGYHVCWLTTSNPRDPVHGRLRMGYELIRPEEIPGWEHSTLKTGEYSGCIGVNEMLAAKLPLRLYQMFMAEAHYHGPNREQGKLTSNVDTLKEQALAVRGRIEEEDGQKELRATVPLPDFTLAETRRRVSTV